MFRKSLLGRSAAFLTEPVTLMIPFLPVSTGQGMIVLGMTGVALAFLTLSVSQGWGQGT